MTIAQRPPYINITGVTIRIWNAEKSVLKRINARQVARTIIALVENIKEGVTSLELSNTFAIRTSQYISDLRHKHGLDIEMVREENAYNWHGRYFLRTPVEIVEIHYEEDDC